MEKLHGPIRAKRTGIKVTKIKIIKKKLEQN